MFKKKHIVAKLTDRERGQAEAFAAMKQSADANYLAILKGFAEKHKVELSEDVVFDPAQAAFVRAKK